jgi:anti-anti-sigma regulatory factor
MVSVKNSSNRSRKKSVISVGKADGKVVFVPENADILSAHEFSKKLINAVNSDSKKMVIDLSMVVRLTTPCVQLMLSAGKTMSEAGGVLIFKSPSDAAGAVFSDLGLEVEFNEWSEGK